MRMLLFGFRHAVCLVAEPTLFAFVGGAAVQRHLIIVAVYIWQLGGKKSLDRSDGGVGGGATFSTSHGKRKQIEVGTTTVQV